MCAMGLEKLTRLAKVDYGFPFESSLFTDNSVYMPLIRIRDIKPAKASTYYEGEYSDRYVVRKGDILVGMDGEFNLERWNDRDGLLNQRILRIKAIDGLSDESYLYHLLAPLFKKIEKKVQGGSVKHLSAKIIENLYIPYVDFEEQVLIGKHLDTFTTLISNLESELDMRRKQYEHYRNQLLDFEGVEGVEWKTLGEVCKIMNGKDYKSLSDGNVPVYGSGGIMAYVDTFAYNRPSVLLPRKGSLNNVFYVDEPFWTVDTIYWTIINEEIILPKYFYCYMAMQNLEKLNIAAGAVPSLTQSILNKINIPLPTIFKQQEIVEKLDTFENLIQSLEQEIKLRKQQYEYYREKLLTFEKE